MNHKETYQKIQQFHRSAGGQYAVLERSVNEYRARMENARQQAQKAEAESARAEEYVGKIERVLRARAQEAEQLSRQAQRSSSGDTQQEQQQATQERQQIQQRLQQIRDEMLEMKAQQQHMQSVAAEQSSLAQQQRGIEEQNRNDLRMACTSCDKIAWSLDGYASVLEQEIIPFFGQVTGGLQDVAGKRYTGGAGQHARETRDQQNSANALKGQIARLAESYRRLAQTADNAQADGSGEGGEGSNAANASMGGKSMGMGARGRQLAVGTMVAASMLTGAGYHATRPRETFDADYTPQQVMAQRWDNVQNALTPDDYLSDLERKREFESDPTQSRGRSR